MKVCLLASGSNGNACYVERRDVRMLIDLGIGPRVLARRLQSVGRDPAEITHLLLTHEHTDHVSGIAGLLKRTTDVEIHATQGTLKGLPSAIRRRVRPLNTRRALNLGALTVHSFRTSHDAAQSVGFRVEGPRGALGYATDLGHFSEAVVAGLSGCSGLVVEANHCPDMLRTGPYPQMLKTRVAGPMGHLSNAQSRELLSRILHPGVEFVALAHLSAANNTDRAVQVAMEELVGGPLPPNWFLGSRTSALAPFTLGKTASVGMSGQQLHMPFL